MRCHYFSPGPARLPEAVRTRIHAELLDTFGIGVSIFEISHRSKQYDALNQETLELARSVFEVPSSHEVLITPFGAQQHFSLVISHLSLPGETIGYTDTGIWAHLAVQDAEASGRKLALIYDGKPDYKSLGDPTKWNVPEKTKFVHLTVNNTVYGTEYPTIPAHLNAPLVLDMTSALGARCDIPWEKTAIVYASAQKNFGIAGASVVIVRNDILEQSKELTRKNLLGNALTYHAIHAAKSALNTPPVFPIYAMNRMLHWMRDTGGVVALEDLSKKKAALIYNELDGSFYKGRCEKSYRSRHNFVFNLPTPELDARFVADAAKEGILEIKGYRSVGGIRASAYNGVSLESTQALSQFMKTFRNAHG